jgi:O-antigen/teichoic acid export membrane protein
VDLTLSQAAPLLGGFLVTFGSAAALGPAGRGELAFVTSTSTVAGAILFVSLHVGTTQAQTTGTAGLRRGIRLASAIVGTGVLVGLVTAAVLPAGTEVGPVGRSGFLAIVLGTGLVAANLYVLRSIQGLGQHRAFRNAWAIQSLLYLVLGLSAAVVTRSVGLVVAAWFVGLVVATVYGWRTYAALVRSGPTEPADAGTVLRTSLLAHVGTVGIQMLYRADVVILGLFATAADVGVYSIAVAVAGLIWVVAEAFGLAAFARGGTESAEALQARDRRLVRVNAVLSVAAAVVIGALAVALLDRLLPAYAASVPLLLVLLPGVVVQGPSRVAFASLLRRADTRIPMWIGLVSLGLSLVYVPCASRWQATGVAVASTVVYVVQAALVLWLWRRSPAGPVRSDGRDDGDVNGPGLGTESTVA